MLLRKQKHNSMKRVSSFSTVKNMAFLNQYRSQICPVDFNLKEVQTYGSILPIEMQNIQSSTINQQILRQIVVDSLKLAFIYQPLLQTLKIQWNVNIFFPFKLIMRILDRGQFYRFIQNSQNRLKILVNNRTTEANVKIIKAALFVYALKKLRYSILQRSIDDISTALLFFSLQSALYHKDKISTELIPLDNQKIIKALRKLQRIVKPIQFKIWLQAVKSSKDFNGEIEPHQFLYLCSLAQTKGNNGLSSILFRPKIQSLFKNINSNIKSIQFDNNRQLVKQNKEERRIIRGLSFADYRPVKYGFSKEILKQLRVRDPSKNKRPNTAYLRRHVSSFMEYYVNSKTIQQKLLKDKKQNWKGQRMNNKPSKVMKKRLEEKKKQQFKLKLKSQFERPAIKQT